MKICTMEYNAGDDALLSITRRTLVNSEKMYLSNLIIYMYTRVFITLYKYCRNFFVASTISHNNFTKDNFTKEHPQIASCNIISFEVKVIEREYEERKGPILGRNQTSE